MIYYFWDKENDELEILGEDGEFYYCGHDSVLVEQGDPEAYYWGNIEKICDVTPLNTRERFEIMHPETGEWMDFLSTSLTLFKEVHRHAGVRDWESVG